MRSESRLVAAGYDRIAERCRDWSRTPCSGAGGVRGAGLSRVLARLPRRAHVLDLGCGAGATAAQLVAEGQRVTGLDISARQIALARRWAPEAAFLRADMATRLPQGPFDAAVALDAVTHLPAAEQPALVRRVERARRPGGLWPASLGSQAKPGGVEPDWLGVPMPFGGLAPEEKRAAPAGAGSRPLEHRVAPEPKADPVTRVHWVIAERRASL